MKHLILLFALLPPHLLFSQAEVKPYLSNQMKFSNPLGIVKAPGLEDYFFILEQRGKIYRLTDKQGSKEKVLFLDLSKTVSQEGSETGLLGMAFHPDFQKSRRLFLSFTSGTGKNLKSNIAEIQAIDSKGTSFQNPKIKILIQISQPYTNHNGGAICFGNDGFLYFSWGDGGAGGDPQKNAQNLSSHLGKIHRIDVNKPTPGKFYGIPADNPFVGKPGAKPEIFAYGLRNVWQMSFDPSTGNLWAGDVGQNAFEEIDLIRKGENYGWRIKEGHSFYDKEDLKPGILLQEPVYSYSQSNGDQSVTGGLVYHGAYQPWKGQYLFGDFMSGRIWKLNPITAKPELILDVQKPRHAISCFGQNKDKEILLADYGSGRILVLYPTKH